MSKVQEVSVAADEPTSAACSTSPRGAPARDGGQVTVEPPINLAQVLADKISELERSMGASSHSEREMAKARRKQLRDLQRYVADKSHSAEERIEHVQSKYAAQVGELLRIEKRCAEMESGLELVTKERDRAQADLRRSNALKDKLEELCRQLQKENRLVMEDAQQRDKAEQQLRQELSAKFNVAVEEITTKMSDQQEQRERQNQENDTLRTKLAEALQQYDSWAKLLEKKDLEVKLAYAKLDEQLHVSKQLMEKAELLAAANDSLTKANDLMKAELDSHFQVKEHNVRLAETNAVLQQQVESYHERFSDFQTTMTKSNEMFTSLKKDIEGSSKQQALLVQERDELRRKNDRSDASLVMLLEQVDVLKKQVERSSKQKESLEGLCRALQAKLKLQGQAVSTEDAATTPTAADADAGGARD